jgi:serine/threonine-protein kinase HipA
MKSISKNLFVFANLEGEFVPAGKLTMEEEGSNLTTSSFAYGLRYLERKKALEIDPVSLSLRDKTKVKNISLAPQNGLEYFGGIRDASPDSWGRRVIEAKLRAPTNSLPESTYLLEAGSDRIGALDIRESLTALERPLQNTIHHLSYLLDGAARIEEGLPIPDALAQIFVAGSGLGGMRPKASIRDDENILWMAKFPGRTDSVADFPLIEFATMQLAKIAGLNVAETKLIKVQNKNVFLIKRFDRSWTNNPKPIEIDITC